MSKLLLEAQRVTVLQVLNEFFGKSLASAIRRPIRLSFGVVTQKRSIRQVRFGKNTPASTEPDVSTPYNRWTCCRLKVKLCLAMSNVAFVSSSNPKSPIQITKQGLPETWSQESTKKQVVEQETHIATMGTNQS